VKREAEEDWGPRSAMKLNDAVLSLRAVEERKTSSVAPHPMFMMGILIY